VLDALDKSYSLMEGSLKRNSFIISLVASMARDRPRPRARAETADPGRADRRHPANIIHEIGNIFLRLNKEEGLTVLLVNRSCRSRGAAHLSV
jgi:hypothetical protein